MSKAKALEQREKGYPNYVEDWSENRKNCECRKDCEEFCNCVPYVLIYHKEGKFLKSDFHKLPF